MNFARVFISVFMLVVITSTVVTFILPESYASTARVAVEGDQAGEINVIESDAILGPVIEKLDLSNEWGRKYTGGNPLKTTETMQLLKQRMSLKPERGTKFIDITIFSEDKDEAARIANAVADSYRSHESLALSNSPVAVQKVEIVDAAVPAKTPARPNKPLNLFIGAVAGIALGSIAGGIILALTSVMGRKSLKA